MKYWHMYYCKYIKVSLEIPFAVLFCVFLCPGQRFEFLHDHGAVQFRCSGQVHIFLERSSGFSDGLQHSPRNPTQLFDLLPELHHFSDLLARYQGDFYETTAALRGQVKHSSG